MKRGSWNRDSVRQHPSPVLWCSRDGFQTVPGWPWVDMLLITMCVCACSSFQDDMDFFGSCSTLEPPRTQQQQRPDRVSDYCQSLHRLSQPLAVCSHRLFETPAADLRAPRQRIQTEYVHKCKQRHFWGNAKQAGKGVKTLAKCEHAGPEGEIEWSSTW